jgi:hypothetical protein
MPSWPGRRYLVRVLTQGYEKSRRIFIAVVKTVLLGRTASSPCKTLLEMLNKRMLNCWACQNSYRIPIYVETSVRNKCRCSFYCALLTLHVSAPIGGHLICCVRRFLHILVNTRATGCVTQWLRSYRIRVVAPIMNEYYMHLLLGNRPAGAEQGISCCLAFGNRTLQRWIKPLLGKRTAQQYRRLCFPFGPPRGYRRKVVLLQLPSPCGGGLEYLHRSPCES